jgi:hypothetical protein
MTGAGEALGEFPESQFNPEGPPQRYRLWQNDW